MQIKLISYSESKLVAMNVAHRMISNSIRIATGIDEKFLYCATPQDMFAGLKQGIEEADVILIAVDISKFISTKAALFRALGFKCRLNSEIIDHINSDACMATLNEKQTKAHAAIPVGGEAFITVDGLFSGVGVKEGRQKLIFVPIDDKRINSIIQNGMISFLLKGAEELYYSYEEPVVTEAEEETACVADQPEEMKEDVAVAIADAIVEEQVEESVEETTEEEQVEESVEEATEKEQVEEPAEEATEEEQVEEPAEETTEEEQVEEPAEEATEEKQIEESAEETAEEDQVQEKIESDIPADMVGYVEHIDPQQYVEPAANSDFEDIYSSTSVETAEDISEGYAGEQNAYFTPAETLPEGNINVGEPEFIVRLRDVISRGFKVSFSRQNENAIYANFLAGVANVYGVDFVDFPVDATLTEDIRRKEVLASKARRTLRQTNSVFAVSMSELYYGEDNTAYIFVTLADIQKSSVYKIFAADGETAEDLYRIGFESVLEKMEEMVKNANLVPLQVVENNAPVQEKRKISSSTLIGIWVLVIIAVATFTALILDSALPADGSVISSAEAIIENMNNILPR